MNKARRPANEHRDGESCRPEHVFPIGLTNFVEVVGEKRHLLTPPAGSDDAKLPHAEEKRLEHIS